MSGSGGDSNLRDMPRRPQNLVHSEAELVTKLGCTDNYTIDDWLSNACEFADGTDYVGDDSEFGRVLFHYANTYSEQYVISLPYPFPLTEIEEEASRAELFFRGAMHAHLGFAGSTIGVPDGEDDATEELAAEVLGGADVTTVTQVLAGEWQRVEFEDIWGSNGEVVYSWFIPANDRMVALGIGADALYVAPLFGDEQEGYWVEEWPDPTIGLWWTGPWVNGTPTDDPDTTVESLRHALAAYTTASGRGTGSQDHTVRLTTKNQPVTGIDFDFEVTKGGRRLGTLSVSQGGLLWRPARARRRQGRAKAGIKISWAEFVTWAQSE
jgi:hypothetical protein